MSNFLELFEHGGTDKSVQAENLDDGSVEISLISPWSAGAGFGTVGQELCIVLTKDQAANLIEFLRSANKGG